MAAQEEANAELLLSQIKAKLGPNLGPYEESQAASATVASRIRGAELQKLRFRWVHDIQKLETEKIGLNMPPKGKGKGKRAPLTKGKQSGPTQGHPNAVLPKANAACQSPATNDPAGQPPRVPPRGPAEGAEAIRTQPFSKYWRIYCTKRSDLKVRKLYYRLIVTS